MTIDVITTVYNRREELTNLYTCLMNQSDTNFSWIIVDDGSQVPLDSLVDYWRKKSKFNITLLSQSNKGKMAAYKVAAYNSKATWSMVVDSDDIVSSNCISNMRIAINNLEENTVGAVFPKNIYDNRKWKKIDGRLINIIDLRYRYGINESAILIENRALIKEFEGILEDDEKFLSEEVLYNKLILDGYFKVFNNVFYFSEYQSDGITAKIFQVWLNNPKGTLKLLISRYNALANLPSFYRILGRVKTILNFNSMCMVKKVNLWERTPNRFLSGILLLPSILLRYSRF